MNDRQSADGSYIAQADRGSISVINVFHESAPAPVDENILSRGLELLGDLPIDALPPVVALPDGSRMPLPRNPLFVGREDDLKSIARLLKAGETAAVGQIAAATGIGGIGKTQLACEFVHHFGQFFAGGVFWINFADPDAVPADVAVCAGAGGMDLLSGFDKLPQDDQVRMVASQWRNRLPRLLVFDNCDDEVLLQQWRPTTGGCHVLVTSHRQEWSPTLGVGTLEHFYFTLVHIRQR